MTIRTTLLGLLLAAGVGAHAQTGPVRVDAAWSRELPPVSENGAAYVTLHNAGDADDALLGAGTPIAARAAVHEHATVNGVMRMRAVPSLALPAGETVQMAPGGLHLMLFELKAPLRPGDRFPLTLRFRDGPALEVEVEVLGLGEEPPGGYDRPWPYGEPRRLGCAAPIAHDRVTASFPGL